MAKKLNFFSPFRAQIIDDALNLARSGLLSYDIALQVTNYLANEVEYIPWAAALKELNYLKEMLEKTTAYENFKKYINKLVKPVYNRLGYKPDPNYKPLDIFFHKLILKWACNVVKTSCDFKVKGEFTTWMDKLDPDSEESNV